MPSYRIATLEQGASAMAQAHDYQQHGYYDYNSYYQQANVAGMFVYIHWHRPYGTNLFGMMMYGGYRSNPNSLQ